MPLGHYTITLKTIHRNELPPKFEIKPGSHIQCGLRVFHIFWIPLFPFSKVWLIKQDGNLYRMHGTSEQLLDEHYEKPKTPLYAFSGILIGLLFLVFSLFGQLNRYIRYQLLKPPSVEIKGKKKLESKINNPSLNHFYHLKSEHGLYYPAKVKNSSTDSISLTFPANNQSLKSSDLKNLSIFFSLDKNCSCITQTLAKSDLVATIQAGDSDKNQVFKGIPIDGLANGSLVQVDTIHDLQLLIQSKKIESTIKRFTQNPSIDSSLVLLDSSSKKYLLHIARLAKNGSAQEIKNYIDQSAYPSVNYDLLMYARYSYVKTVGKNFPTSDQDLLKEFGFYSKLLDLGLWSIDERLKKVVIRHKNISKGNQAEVDLNLASNILLKPYTMSFPILLNKEEGQWKINLLSSFTYTERQVQLVNPRSKQAKKEYREHVRKRLKKTVPSVKFDQILKY